MSEFNIGEINSENVVINNGPEWISVKDKMPTFEDGQIIVSNYIKGGTPERVVICSVYYGNDFLHLEEYALEETPIIKNVTHWMPLPKPPKS